jgi:HTH-type transcriptional regulator, sugar sensing transcriptional regulator
MNNLVEELLTSLGLSSKEQAIYLAALELGEALQQPLAKKAAVKRTTLRELLPRLLDKGILQQVVKGNRKYLKACDPKELIEKLQLQAQKAQDALPILLALQNTLKDKPEVRFYEGVEGVKQVYQLTLDVAQPMYSYIDAELVHPEIKRWVIGYYHGEKLKRAIQSYNINSPSPENKIYTPLDAYRENRTVSKEEFPFKMEVLIFGDYVAYIHFREDEEPSAILIKSKLAAETMRSAYKLAWEYSTRK